MKSRSHASPGGMHFRSATVDGAALGKSVANWVLARAFQPR
jgi:hypothetical protein